MTLHIVEVNAQKGVAFDQVHVTPLVNTNEVRVLLLNLAAGQSVAPCEMPCPVLYYVIAGQGRLQVDDDRAELRAGSLVLTPAGAVRAISAAEPMRVLAVQVL